MLEETSGNQHATPTQTVSSLSSISLYNNVRKPHRAMSSYYSISLYYETVTYSDVAVREFYSHVYGLHGNVMFAPNIWVVTLVFMFWVGAWKRFAA